MAKRRKANTITTLTIFAAKLFSVPPHPNTGAADVEKLLRC